LQFFDLIETTQTHSDQPGMPPSLINPLSSVAFGKDDLDQSCSSIAPTGAVRQFEPGVGGTSGCLQTSLSLTGIFERCQEHGSSDPNPLTPSFSKLSFNTEIPYLGLFDEF
jgi:hypothetical protein